MSKMKFYFYITLFIIFTVTASTIVLILLPFWQYSNLPQKEITLSEFSDDESSSSIQWIAKSQKTGLYRFANQNADLLFFTSKNLLTEEYLNAISGKVLFFEQLFSQIEDNQFARNNLNYLSGVDFSGFSGKTYENLGDIANIPEKIVQLYESEHSSQWNFFGEGIIITNGKTVIVLRRGIEYSGSLIFSNNEMIIDYQGIFEITQSEETKLADFSIQLNDSGKQLFGKYGLPSTFPAAYFIPRNLYDAYYFAGDFSSFQVTGTSANKDMAALMKQKLLYSKFSNEEVFWRWYYPLIEKVILSSEEKIINGEMLVSLKEPEKENVFSITGRDINITRASISSDFFVTGVNLGTSLPGTFFTEFPESKETYLHWFKDIQSLQVNTVRIYTLLPPVFYQALFEFNQKNPSPLFILQEIWPEENPSHSNLLDMSYNQTYRQEIEYTIHAIHGNVQIPKRDFRAYGIYAYDVSPYLLGYLVGREVEPEEVLETDRLNKNYLYEGDYFYSTEQSTPTESWLAASCDFAMTVEGNSYQNRPLIAIVSWPTLDPIVHPSEWVTKDIAPYNDKAVVDINHIGIYGDKIAGFFGAYHIYPNYPDFLNNQPEYAEYEDDQGIFRYGGYLHDFMLQHTKYPAIIAEYGISTSSITAHFNPDGLNHGGLSEIEQAENIIRMTDAIIKEEYSGAIIFEWMDEWAKKTWTTEYYMIPYERHVLWHNVLDPEQNYGLLAYQVPESEMKELNIDRKDIFEIQNVSVGQNLEFLEIEITCAQDCMPSNPISLAISTYEDEKQETPVWEYLLVLDDTPSLLVNPDYNWLEGKYASTISDFSEFEPLIQITNSSYGLENGEISAEITENLSSLSIGEFNNNENQVSYDGNQIKIRLAYGLLGISDPSSRSVLFDERVFLPSAIDQINIIQTDKVNFRLVQNDETYFDFSYKLETWETPQYAERLKDGFEKLAEYFGDK